MWGRQKLPILSRILISLFLRLPNRSCNDDAAVLALCGLLKKGGKKSRRWSVGWIIARLKFHHLIERLLAFSMKRSIYEYLWDWIPYSFFWSFLANPKCSITSLALTTTTNGWHIASFPLLKIWPCCHVLVFFYFFVRSFVGGVDVYFKGFHMFLGASNYIWKIIACNVAIYII